MQNMSHELGLTVDLRASGLRLFGSSWNALSEATAMQFELLFLVWAVLLEPVWTRLGGQSEANMSHELGLTVDLRASGLSSDVMSDFWSGAPRSEAECPV